MMLKVFSVFDTKLATFGRPWYELTEASAIRVFSDAVNDNSNQANQWFKHPEDFSLYLLGEFDDQLGTIEKCTPRSLVTAASVFDFKKAVQPELNGLFKEPAIK